MWSNYRHRRLLLNETLFQATYGLSNQNAACYHDVVFDRAMSRCHCLRTVVADAWHGNRRHDPSNDDGEPSGRSAASWWDGKFSTRLRQQKVRARCLKFLKWQYSESKFRFIEIRQTASLMRKGVDSWQSSNLDLGQGWLSCHALVQHASAFFLPRRITIVIAVNIARKTRASIGHNQSPWETSIHI